jgi:hypothetical protein
MHDWQKNPYNNLEMSARYWRIIFHKAQEMNAWTCGRICWSVRPSPCSTIMNIICLLILFFDPEDRGSSVFRIVGKHLTYYKASRPRRYSPSLSPSREPQIKHHILFSLMCATCPAHLMFLDFITLILFDEEYNLQNSPLSTTWQPLLVSSSSSRERKFVA